eukprot:6659948-Prymnesium_polylepis.1
MLLGGGRFCQGRGIRSIPSSASVCRGPSTCGPGAVAVATCTASCGARCCGRPDRGCHGGIQAGARLRAFCDSVICIVHLACHCACRMPRLRARMDLAAVRRSHAPPSNGPFT